MKKRILQFLPVLLIMIVAIYCRYRFNFFQSTITGDGAYYPLQVRSILENFRLALPDMPLYFYFTALVARILLFVNSSAPDETIIFAVKIVDILIPVLSAFIVYSFSRLIANQGNLKFSDYLMIAFSVLSTSYIVFASGELQKTAIGIVLIFAFLLLVYRYIKNVRLHFAKIAVLILLIAFTHFGSFTIVALFVLIFILVNIKEVAKWIKSQDKTINLALTLGILIPFTGIYFFDTARFFRIISIPAHIFDAPRILFLAEGNPILNMYMILINLLAIVALIVVIRNKEKVGHGAYKFINSLIILAFVLSSPLLNNEIFWRFIIFSFIPITIIYLMVFRFIDNKLLKYIIIPVFSVMILHSTRTGLVGHRRPSISKEAYTELQSIKDHISLKNNSVVITRLFLGWWIAWELNTNVSQDYAITESDLKKYHTFYFLRQIKAKDTFGNNILDMEVEIPSTAKVIYKGENFEFYELTNKEDYKILPHQPPLAIGKISGEANGSFTINNGKLNYKVNCHNNCRNIKNGDIVKVWGAFRPFSNVINAEKIILCQL